MPEASYYFSVFPQPQVGLCYYFWKNMQYFPVCHQCEVATKQWSFFVFFPLMRFQGAVRQILSPLDGAD